MQELEVILEEIDGKLKELESVDDEFRNTALSMGDWENARYFRKGLFSIRIARNVVKEIINKYI